MSSGGLEIVCNDWYDQVISGKRRSDIHKPISRDRGRFRWSEIGCEIDGGIAGVITVIVSAVAGDNIPGYSSGRDRSARSSDMNQDCNQWKHLRSRRWGMLTTLCCKEARDARSFTDTMRSGFLTGFPFKKFNSRSVSCRYTCCSLYLSAG
jgi:hypothetical protein